MAHDMLDVLLDSLDRLRKQHRSGINPHPGEIAELFEVAADVRRLFRRELASPITAAGALDSTTTPLVERHAAGSRDAGAVTGAPARVVVEGQPEAVAQTIRAIARGRRAA